MCCKMKTYSISWVCKWVNFQHASLISNILTAVMYICFFFLILYLSPLLPHLRVFTSSSVSLSLLSISIFYLSIHFTLALSFTVSLQPQYEWDFFFFLFSSLHNCLDKSHIDCACRLELISLCTVFSFLFGSSRYDERFSMSIHQSNAFGSCAPWEQNNHVTLYEQNKKKNNWSEQLTDKSKWGFRGIH